MPAPEKVSGQSVSGQWSVEEQEGPRVNLLQLEYKAGGNGDTQNERILDALKQWPAGEWCPMPHLARCASPNGNGVGLAVHSRIADIRRALRDKGYTVELHKEMVGGQSHTFYRITKLQGEFAI